MKKQVLFNLILILSIIPFYSYSQKRDSIYIINRYGLSDIKIGDRIKKEQLSLYPNYRKIVKINHMFDPLTLTKEYIFEDGLRFFLTKKKRGSFIYLVESIIVKYPCKAITDKGIEIGKSSKKDVIEKYGNPTFENENVFTYKTETYHYIEFLFNLDSTNIVSEIIIK